MAIRRRDPPRSVHKVDLHPADILSDVVGGLTAGQLGAYYMISLLCLRRGGYIPDDTAWLREKFKRTAGLRTLADDVEHLVASARVCRAHGQLSVSWCSAELELASSRIRASVEHGSRGGRPSRKNKDLEKSPGFSDEKLPPPPPPPPPPPERGRGRARRRPLSQQDFVIDDGLLAKAAAAREGAELPPVNLKAEAAKYMLAPRVNRSEGDWLKWALHARADLEGPKTRAASASAGTPEVNREPWVKRLEGWASTGFWMPNFGPPPDDPACHAPRNLVEQAIGRRGRAGSAGLRA